MAREKTIKLLLVLSLLLNCLLGAALLVLGSQFTDLYSSYRQYRTLSPDRSDAGRIPPATETPRADSKLLVVFGDSRVSDWQLLPDIDNIRSLNAGVHGESTAEMRRRFEQDVLRFTPDIVFIQAGVNDVSAAATRGIQLGDQILQQIESNLRYFIEASRANGAEVIVSSIIESRRLNPLRRYFWPLGLNNSIRLLNQKLQAISDETGAVWIDLNALLSDTDYRDTLHLTPLAYGRINEEITPLLKELAAR